MSDATEREELGYGAPRVVLVGESNPGCGIPHYALGPLPPTGSGGRLARILGLSDLEYLRAFPRRVNLLTPSAYHHPETPPKWSAPKARRRADELLYRTPFGSGLVLLGAKVAAAFRVEYRENLFSVRYSQVGSETPRRFWVAVIPHPSGLNRIWHEPNSAELARSAVESLRERVAERADIVASQPSSDLAVTLERIAEIEMAYAEEMGWTLQPLRRVVESLAASDVALPPAEVAVTQGSGRYRIEGFRAYYAPAVTVQYARVLFRVPHKWRRLRVCLSCSAQFVDVCVEDFSADSGAWSATSGLYPAGVWARDSALFDEAGIVRCVRDLLMQLRDEANGAVQ